VVDGPGDHFFRSEAGRIVATLTRIFGVHNLPLAEDVVQDALCRALEVWKFRGVPENPSAWLTAAAKNRALDVLRRERTARTFAPEVGRWLESEWTLAPTVDELFESSAINDDQLRMIFSCCQPRLAEEAQVALVLNVLCGFSVSEIAGAFLCSTAAIEKRISRAKGALAKSSGLFDLKGPNGEGDFAARICAVHRVLYLLFNEGYHGANDESPVRVDLCREAMRLASLLRDSPVASTPATHALSALMCLHAARLPSRLDAVGDLTLLVDQDRSRWDAALVSEGMALLELSARGSELTEYHVEAAIAAVHAEARSAGETNWPAVVSLYDTLLTIRPSPVVALNRAIAIAQSGGAERGLQAIAAIEDRARLAVYPFYHAALGELELRRGRREVARDHFRAALSVARSAAERRLFEKRVDDIPGVTP
jgi:RNA polymerase sigma factor (sigma-70 family)